MPLHMHLYQFGQMDGTRLSALGMKWVKRWRNDFDVRDNEVSALTGAGPVSLSGLRDWIQRAQIHRSGFILRIPTLIVVSLPGKVP